MLYLKENLENQLNLLSFISSIPEYELVIWFYPDSKINKIASYEVVDNIPTYEPITTYEEGTYAKRTIPIPVNPESLSNTIKTIQESTKIIDSLALYKTSSNEWEVCIIGHEGIALVKDTSLKTTLKENGFNASLESPNGW